MRILHTADWHLGRIFQGVHLTEDQAHVLDQVVDLAREWRPDVVVLAGDVYDRAVPPPDAVTLFDDVLSRLVLGLGLPVVVIAGNHDGPERVGFASRVLRGRGLHLAGVYRPDEPLITLGDEHGPVHVAALPFVEPQAVKERLFSGVLPEGSDRWTHGAALAAVAKDLRGRVPSSERAVAVAHASVVGGLEAESERPLWVSASGYAEPSCFEGFCYTALGHFHRPQVLSGERGEGPFVAYSGSLLKYSFAEAGEEKSVSLVEVDGQGRVSLERAPLVPRRDVRVIAGPLEEVLARADEDRARDDYVKVVLEDKEPVLDAMARLRLAYPNVLHVEQPRWLSSSPLEGPAIDGVELRAEPLFERFFAEVTGEPLRDEERRCLAEALSEHAARRRERAA